MTKPTDSRVELLRRHFLGREEVIAFLAPWNRPCPAETQGHIEALLAAHVHGTTAPQADLYFHRGRTQGPLKGHFRLGSYAPSPEGTTKWLCLDFDGGEHAEALADPQAVALQVQASFTAAGLPIYLELSGSGRGWHLWCFFDPPLSAATARSLAAALLPATVTLTSGEVIHTNTGRGIEVFPKQAKIRAKRGYGNLVWLPWWAGATAPANQFHREEEGGLVPFLPEAFTTADPAKVERVVEAAKELARADDAQPWDTVAPGGAGPEEGDPVWREWRAQALAALPLEAVYGPWLTGKRHSTGWLECRDPWSPTGDQHPSAGVADGTGEAQRGRFRSFVDGKPLSVFDFLIKRGEVPDFAAAREHIARLSGVPTPVAAAPRPSRPGAAAGPGRPLPQIRVNGRQLRVMRAQAWEALLAANAPPQVFLRAGQPVWLLPDPQKGPSIAVLDESGLYGHLSEVADWVRVTQDGASDVLPLHDVARTMLARPHPGLPVLERLISAPAFTPEGGLILAPGYDAAARVWYHPVDDLDIAPLPAAPSAPEVAAARDLLFEEVLADFPFAAPADRAHAVAALLLPFVRQLISGPTPVHLLEAPTPGSGKGLLADMVALPATGRCCEPTTVTPDEEEVRKKLTALLLKAPPVILLDNVRAGLESSQLAAALTAEEWSDRMLGQNRMIDLPNRATWLVTANNPRLSLEIARRCIRVRLDPHTDRPWQRQGFRHSPLREWVSAHRAEIVRALLLLGQAWLAAGRPPGPRTLGSFESWSQVLGGILSVSGIDGFLGNIEELYEVADTRGGEWRSFVAVWWEAFRERRVAVRELLELALERDLLGTVVGDKSLRSQQIRLGLALSSIRDQHIGEWRVHLEPDSHTKSAAYRLSYAGPGAPDAGGGGRACGDLTGEIPPSGAPREGTATAPGTSAGTRGISSLPFAQEGQKALHTHASHAHIERGTADDSAASRGSAGRPGEGATGHEAPRNGAGTDAAALPPASRKDADAEITSLADLPDEWEDL